MTKTIFEKTQKGQKAFSLPKSSEKFEAFTPDPSYVRKSEIPLPECSEIDITRHFSELSMKNVGIDNLFYPLGSCTMKLNPRINEEIARFPHFVKSHPLAPEESVQGNLQIAYELTEKLCQISGMDAGTLAPNAGAQGEFVGVKMIAAYHKERGDTKRTEMLIPDNAHGTNPATARMCGFTTISITTTPEGDINLEELRELVSDRTAGLMLTNPNTLGVISKNILEAQKIIHEAGGLLYYDGANLNAILQIARPGDMGFDVMHINLHKTFSTPHGGGGPGSGPVFCKERLKKYLPLPRIKKNGDFYSVEWENSDSIGHVASFFGNSGIFLRAYLYIILHGKYGLRRIAEHAVLNANYLKKRLGSYFTIPYPQYCMHEFVVQADNYLDHGIKALDIAKRMLDFGVHAPTIYFPLIVKECMLIEPTESESKATLDNFVSIIETIVKEINENPDHVKTAPHCHFVTRLDEVKAAKQPILKAK